MGPRCALGVVMVSMLVRSWSKEGVVALWHMFGRKLVCVNMNLGAATFLTFVRLCYIVAVEPDENTVCLFISPLLCVVFSLSLSLSLSLLVHFMRWMQPLILQGDINSSLAFALSVQQASSISR